MIKRLFRRKSLDRIAAEVEHSPAGKLKRALGALDLISLGIGAIIGAGIFTTLGEAVAGGKDYLGAGPAVILSFIITAITCAFCALSYAEFAVLVPISGSAYTYSYATLGELVAWIIGWDLILEYAIGNVAVALGWAAYFHQLCSGIGWHIPAWIAVDYRSAHQAAEAVAKAGGAVAPNLALAYAAWQQHPTLLGVPLIFNFLALIIVALLTALLYVGVKESARFNNVVVALKLGILVFFIGVGAYYVKPANWTPFMPNGFAGVWAGASLIFFAFIGFDAISTASEETRNPARDLPIGIIGSLVLCTIIYVAAAVVLTGLLPSKELGVADPLAMVFARLGLNWVAGVISLGAVIAMTAVLLVFQLGQPRIFFSMARDGLLPPYFAKVHPRFQTPHITTVWTGVFVGVGSALTNIEDMVELCNIGTLFAFVLVNIGIILLRRTDPDRHRAFRTPGVPFVPLLGTAMCLYLMLGLARDTWIRFIVWLVIGLVLYFCYGFSNSRLHTQSEVNSRD